MDDLVVLLAPTSKDQSCLSEVLRLFAGASGLVTNFDKCVITPICCDESVVANTLQVFPCVVQHFPCKYLGIPLSLRKLNRASEQPLVDAVAARLPTWKALLLTNAGRVLLTKITLSAILVHLSIACCLSQWAINQIDKRRRAFLWAGVDTVSGGKCKVAWPVVCRLAGLGGLGVLDLRFFGFALHLRWEWLAKVEPHRCWTSLLSKVEKTVQAMCKASLSAVVGDGASAKLWSD